LFAKYNLRIGVQLSAIHCCRSHLEREREAAGENEGQDVKLGEKVRMERLRKKKRYREERGDCNVSA